MPKPEEKRPFAGIAIAPVLLPLPEPSNQLVLPPCSNGASCTLLGQPLTPAYIRLPSCTSPVSARAWPTMMSNLQSEPSRETGVRVASVLM